MDRAEFLVRANMYTDLAEEHIERLDQDTFDRVVEILQNHPGLQDAKSPKNLWNDPDFLNKVISKVILELIESLPTELEGDAEAVASATDGESGTF